MMNPKNIFPILLALILLASFPTRSIAKAIDEHIYLVVAGDVDRKVLEELRTCLPDYLPMNVKVEIDSKKELPQNAYDPSRKQYMAMMVTDEIANHMTIDTVEERVLVVTDADLYNPDFDFVFGSADSKKGICIISLARLKNESQILKEAVCELGRSRGLDYCKDPKCVMHFSKDISDIDRKKDKLCHNCDNDLLSKYRNPVFKTSIKPLI